MQVKPRFIRRSFDVEDPVEVLVVSRGRGEYYAGVIDRINAKRGPVEYDVKLTRNGASGWMCVLL